MKKATPIPFILLLFLIYSCKKDSFINSPDARLGTSADSLHFDTLFTSTGSTTQQFKIYNNNNQKLRISRVQLSGGSASFFKMNVDGIAGTDIQDLEMEPNDSIYVFVAVKIDPNAADLPFVVQDSIRIEFNGNEHWVQLDAWGQNANFMRSRVIQSNETWTNNRPYVILGGLLVDSNATLTIEKGCRIYLHADAPLIVDGTLQVNGQADDSLRVLFTGDRLDDPYRDFPASWPGIYFRAFSRDNILKYSVIKNAYQGLVCDQPSPNANPKLTLRECIVDNCYDAGILGIRTGIDAVNCLISNCGKNMILAYGGNYKFLHCTNVAYSSSFLLHKEPVALLTDYIQDGTNLLTSDMSADFTNCIFWGDNGTVDNEVVTIKKGNKPFSANFLNCLWKLKDNPANSTLTNIIANQEPLFDTVNTQKRYYDFHLRGGSPALEKGAASSVNIDLDGKPRPVNLPDIGCYEKQ